MISQSYVAATFRTASLLNLVATTNHFPLNLICLIKSYLESNTLPQDGAWRFWMPNLSRKGWNYIFLNAFVNISASWIVVKTSCNRDMSVTYIDFENFFRTKWPSTSICLVRSWNTIIFAMCKAAMTIIVNTHGFIMSNS